MRISSDVQNGSTDEQDEYRLPAPRHARDRVSDRIADGEQDERGEGRDLTLLT